MSTSYDGSLLDHLAEHMVYLSTATSFWFSLDSSYDDEFHLSQRLGMSPQAYKSLFVAARPPVAGVQSLGSFGLDVRLFGRVLVG